MKKTKTIDVTKNKSSQLKTIQKLSAVVKRSQPKNFQELADMVKWSQPKNLQELADIFDIHRNTMRQWLKDQVICNQQLSARRWRIPTYEFPEGFE